MKCECSVVRPEEGDEEEDSGEGEVAGVPGGGEQEGRGAGDKSHVFLNVVDVQNLADILQSFGIYIPTLKNGGEIWNSPIVNFFKATIHNLLHVFTHSMHTGKVLHASNSVIGL